LTQSCLRALWAILSTSWLVFFSDMHCQLWDLFYIDRCVPFQIMSNLIYCR
jgi:hypothetical protein